MGAGTHLTLIAPSVLRRATAVVVVIVAVFAVWLAVVTELDARLHATDGHVIAEDALTYLAAGERLNADHSLYSLEAGDRPVAGYPDQFPAPLLSPPPIAVVWRALAPFGSVALATWMLAVAAAVLGTAAVALRRSPILGGALVLVSALGIAEQVAVGNVAAFFAPAVLVMWLYRDRPWIGAIAATMAAFKLAPIVVVAWLVGTRRWKAVGVFVVTLAAWGLVSVVGAGPGSLLEYVDVARLTGPSPISLSGMTGIAWLSYAALATFGVLALVSGKRDGGSFATAVTAFTLFAPAFYLAAMVTIPPLALPLGERRDPGETDMDPDVLTREEQLAELAETLHARGECDKNCAGPEDHVESAEAAMRSAGARPG